MLLTFTTVTSVRSIYISANYHTEPLWAKNCIFSFPATTPTSCTNILYPCGQTGHTGWHWGDAIVKPVFILKAQYCTLT